MDLYGILKKEKECTLSGGIYNYIRFASLTTPIELKEICLVRNRSVIFMKVAL